jgi:hypothetical protein
MKLTRNKPDVDPNNSETQVDAGKNVSKMKVKKEKPIKNRAKKTRHNMGPKRNLVGILIVSAIFIIISVMAFMAFTTIFETETYWVLNQDVPAQGLITPQMLAEVVVQAGGSPQNAIGMREVIMGGTFARIPLQAGDVLSPSNVNFGLQRGTGIPDEWVITTFNILADDAAGGVIQRGEYFDLIGVSTEYNWYPRLQPVEDMSFWFAGQWSGWNYMDFDGDGLPDRIEAYFPPSARYILTSVLALNVTATTTQIGEVHTDGVATFGVEMQYTIGLPPEVAAYFHAALATFDKVVMVRSPMTLLYETERDTEGLSRWFFFWDEIPVVDFTGHTDAMFAQVLRDGSGRPVNMRNCYLRLIDPMEMCEDPRVEGWEQWEDNEVRWSDVIIRERPSWLDAFMGLEEDFFEDNLVPMLTPDGRTLRDFDDNIIYQDVDSPHLQLFFMTEIGRQYYLRTENEITGNIDFTDEFGRVVHIQEVPRPYGDPDLEDDSND